MYKVINDYRGAEPLEIICDTEADVAKLESAPPLSTCLVAETGAVYIVNASGNWVKMGG